MNEKIPTKRPGRKKRQGPPRPKILPRLITVALIASIFGVLYYGLSRNKENKRLAEPEAKSTTSVEGVSSSPSVATSGETKKEIDATMAIDTHQQILQSGDLNELIERAKEIGKGISRLTWPEQVESLKMIIELTGLALQKTEDPDIVREMVLSRLKSMLYLNSIYIQNGVPNLELIQKVEKDAETLKSHPDADLRRAANSALCFILIQEVTRERTEENRKRLMNQLTESSGLVTDDQLASLALIEALEIFSDHEGFDDVKTEGLELLAEQFKLSKNEKTRNLVQVINDKLTTGGLSDLEFGWHSLTTNPKIVDTIRSAVKETIANENVTPLAYIRCLQAAESLNRIDKNPEVVEIFSSIKSSAERLQGDERKSLDETLAAFEKRQQLLNQPFGVSGKCINGEPIEPTEIKSTVILFVDGKADFSPSLRPLIDLDFLRKDDFARFVVYNINPDAHEEFVTKTQDVEDIIFMSAKDTRSYLEQCPVRQTPYIIIVNSKQRVTNIAVDPERIRVHTMSDL